MDAMKKDTTNVLEDVKRHGATQIEWGVRLNKKLGVLDDLIRSYRSLLGIHDVGEDGNASEEALKAPNNLVTQIEFNHIKMDKIFSDLEQRIQDLTAGLSQANLMLGCHDQDMMGSS